MELNQLLKTPDENRDPSWENKFFHALTQAKVSLLLDTPQVGPDNWPYLLVNTELNPNAEVAEESMQSIMRWASEKGVGIAVNPEKEYPDYVFTYGMIWSFKETGFFYQNAPNVPLNQFTIEETQKLKFGAPTEKYLPTYVRNIIRTFLQEQGVLMPRIVMMTQDEKHYDLVFSLESLGSPAEHEHQGVAEAISWFLPPHFSIVVMSEKNIPHFINL